MQSPLDERKLPWRSELRYEISILIDSPFQRTDTVPSKLDYVGSTLYLRSERLFNVDLTMCFKVFAGFGRPPQIMTNERLPPAEIFTTVEAVHISQDYPLWI